MGSHDSFGARGQLTVATSAGEQSYEIFRISSVEGSANLPFTHKVLLENLLRTEDGANVTAEIIRDIGQWDPTAEPTTEIQFTPARVVMQDFTGVPVVVDLATMREAVRDLGGDPARIEPLAPAELVIDHSVIADFFGMADAQERNVALEYERNQERYQFLRWGQGAFDEFKVVPPGTGIVHQVNIESLARVVMARKGQAYPDTVVGTDSHTTMVNGLGVLGWGVGGIEAEAAMLGQPVSMLLPRVVGFKLTGELPQGTTATDLVLTITEILRTHGVVGKFVEFYGDGVSAVPLANRATIGNMSPEYGSTAAIFPIDQTTCDYLRLTGRTEDQIALVETYAREQGLWHDPAHEPRYSEVLELDLSTIEPSLAGPKRPQDRVLVSQARASFEQALNDYTAAPSKRVDIDIAGETATIGHGAVTIAAITSCTNTSNPTVMIGAGLLAKKAVDKGLTRKPWVKTTLAPGSRVVTDYYERSGLLPYLEKLGFDIVGYGCTTCIGNSGPLIPEVSAAVNEHDLAVTSVLSGNRNFEGRINPDVKMNYLASPPLVVAYAIAGTMDLDLLVEPLGSDAKGDPVYLADIWPSAREVQDVIDSSIDTEMFTSRYADVFAGDERWQALQTPEGEIFEWDASSTYVRKPPYFDGLAKDPQPVADIEGARVLALLGDSVTTDHISPAGSIKADSPAGRYLIEHGVDRKDFNSYGSRRGNHEVMIRGTFANIRLRNLMLEGVEGGFTVDFTQGSDVVVPIFDAAMSYAERGIPLV
ncbi:MAG TPA: aconitate hydratase AcnA, partial [Candidatus Nanopelagicales bacterium]|nr:aconitate hydratase AcnA [Candidatus Nanopelagicales bacterium]